MTITTPATGRVSLFALMVSVTTALLAAEVAGSEEPETVSLEEITVTAQRRSESLQTVPNRDHCSDRCRLWKEAAVHELGTLAGQVPGLTFSPFAPGQNIVALRGVSSNDDGAGTDNSVAVFVDDVYLGRVSNINPEMYDVDRVEVLRGPQGTLYGKNTIGGAINIISSRPNTSALDIRLPPTLVTISGATSRAGHGPDSPAGGPASSSSPHARQTGGVDNVVLHTKEKNDNSQSIRGQLLRTGDRSELLLSADYQRRGTRIWHEYR